VPALKLRAQHADAPVALLRDHAGIRCWCGARCWNDRGQDRQVEIEPARPVGERAKILGQAGAAEGEARLQIFGRDIELRVAAEDVHDLMAINAERLGDGADLVAEADLERVPGIVGIFHHLRDLDVRVDHRRVETFIEVGQNLPADLVVAPITVLGD